MEDGGPQAVAPLRYLLDPIHGREYRNPQKDKEKTSQRETTTYNPPLTRWKKENSHFVVGDTNTDRRPRYIEAVSSPAQRQTFSQNQKKSGNG